MKKKLAGEERGDRKGKKEEVTGKRGREGRLEISKEGQRRWGGDGEGREEMRK